MELVLIMTSMRRERKDKYWQCVCVKEITRIRGIGTDRRDRRDRRDRKGSEGSLPIVRDRKRSEGSEKLRMGESWDTIGNWEFGNLKFED